ncbi:MAG: polysaccharide pyruvyl transferase family protein [Pseudomonadota bacterium]
MSSRVLILNDTSIIPHHGCRDVMSVLRQGLQSHGMEITGTFPIGFDWGASDAFNRQVETCDVVVINGEGTIHHDQDRAKALMQAAQYARSAGKRVALVNALFEAISKDWMPLFEGLDLVSIRDRNSQAEFEEFSGRAPLYCPDLVFGAELNAKFEASPANGVAIGDSVLKAVRQELFGLFRKTPGSSYLPIRSTVHRGRGFAVDTVDTAFAHINALYYRARYGRYRMFAESKEFEAHLRSCAYYLTGRFHAACLAIKSRVPVSVIQSNSRKCEALVEECGLDRWRLMKTSPETVPRADEMGYSTAEKEAIDDFLADASRSRNALFSRLSELR